MILTKLKSDGLNVLDCRGQGYDNGANMAGIYNGVQAHIKRMNPYASFIPCAAHSLNLVGHNAASKVLPGKLILGKVQNLYVFFSSSTQRWDVLTKHVKHTLKCQSGTRWSSKTKAVDALCRNYAGVLLALDEIISSEHFNASTLAEATAQNNQIKTFKFILGIHIWNEVLRQINVVNAALQNSGMDIDRASKHLKGLVASLNDFSKTGFELVLEKASLIAAHAGISEESGFTYRLTRNRIPSRFRDDSNEQRNLTNIEKFKEDFFDCVMCKLEQEFGDRFQSLYSATTDFNFLWGDKLANNTATEQIKAAKDLALKYPDDLDDAGLIKESGLLRHFLPPFLPKERTLTQTTALEMLKLLTTTGFKSEFPNCILALRIFLTLPVTVAGNERAFSKLKIVKNYLRSTMGQERLSNLAVLSIEHKNISNVSFEEIIDKFVAVKRRRVTI